MEKRNCFIILTIVLIAIAIGLGVGFGLQKIQNDDDIDYPNDQNDTRVVKICLTEICNNTAEQLQSWMRPEVDPCEDFYQYSCGGWDAANKIPDGVLKIGNFESIQIELNEQMKEVLEEIPTSPKSITAGDKAKRTYSSCLAQSDQNGLDSVNFELRNVIDGGWPMTTKKWSNFDVERTLAIMLRDFQQHNFVTAYVDSDLTNPSNKIIYIGDESIQRINAMQFRNQNESGDPISNNYVQEDLKTTLRRTVCLLQPSCDQLDDLDNDIDELASILKPQNLYSLPKYENTWPEQIEELRLQMKSQNMSSKPYASDSVFTQFRMTVEQLQRRTLLNFNWLDFLKTALEGSGHNVDSNTMILLMPSSKFGSLTAFLSFTKRNMANIVGYFILVNQASLIAPPLKKYFGAPTTKRWEDCVTGVNSAMGFAVAKLYYDKHMTPDKKNQLVDLIVHLKSSLKEQLEKNNWLDSYSKNAALKKLNYMAHSVGAPDWMNDNTLLEEFYAPMGNLIDGNFAENLKKARRTLFLNQFKRIDKPVDRKNDWPKSTPIEGNAFYYPLTNSITMLGGMFLKPLFEVKRPSVMNYGGIGYIVGHELFHGFDPKGILFSESGKYVDESIFSWSSRQNYDVRTRCIRDQYSNILFGGNRVNGLLTLGENVADNGAIKLAYHAFKSIFFNTTLRLPGLELITEDQLFFITTATVWCAKTDPQYSERLLKLDPHAPSEVRAYAPLRNSEEFARAFNCPRGSFMNPKANSKCSVW